MKIHVRLFARQAESCGQTALDLEVPAVATVCTAIAHLQSLHPDLPWPAGTLTAVNMDYVPADAPLHDGDELAIIPPVSGG